MGTHFKSKLVLTQFCLVYSYNLSLPINCNYLVILYLLIVYSRSETIPNDTHDNGILIGSMNLNGFDNQSAWAIEKALKEKNIDIMLLSETHFRADVPRSRYAFNNFESIHTERSKTAKGGGGLSIYYSNTLNVQNYTPNVASMYEYLDKERQWILLKCGNINLAILNVYMCCVRNDLAHLDWNTDLYAMLYSKTIVLRNKGFKIVALGDFNANRTDTKLSSEQSYNQLKFASI